MTAAYRTSHGRVTLATSVAIPVATAARKDQPRTGRPFHVPFTVCCHPGGAAAVSILASGGFFFANLLLTVGLNMSSETKEDEDDGRFLEQLLDHFYEFDNGPAPKQQKKKKKKRKRCEEEEELTAVKDICPSDTEDCGAAATATEQQHQQPNAEPTGTTVRQVSRVEVVTFQDPRKKLKTKRTPAADKTPAPPLTEKKQSDQHEAIDFEKARLDVHRFGITGYKKEQQRVFEQDRAIMLGARPPKKDCVNYKLLQQQVKEKKQKAKEEVQPDLKKKKKPNNHRDKKKVSSSGPGSAPSGQVGRFKNGMLILSTKEIQKIKSNKRRK
ncbi:uncharacterized protein C1orf131 homolog isoform X2 [Scophthalmus maximus]|uniref:uncharacterized protein C1orf131 homolog isoform X2 n=1 Tax=Scophthalmus maximus TaxID=52904 RepID=UPI001FA8CCCD|nr:uncharacterized protein C1orf131 homolog isoform X2 [Scophthalmus maximus]